MEKKKLKAFMRSVPKLRHTGAFRTVIDPTDESRLGEYRTNTECIGTIERLLGSFLTDNAISVQVMCLLQLDLELSVQCPMSVHKRRGTMKINM